MSREDPTTDEIDAILNHEYGAYGVNLPDWYQTPSDLKDDKGGWLPEAVEIATKAKRQVLTAEEWGRRQWPVPPEADEALGRALDARLDEILPKQEPDAFRKVK